MNDAFFPFDGPQRMGASAVFAFSLLSTMALILVFIRVCWIGLVAVWKNVAVEKVASEGFFLKSQLGQFAGCLLLANLFTAISGIVEINWVFLNGVQHGTTCNAQGALGQIGEFATAYFIVAMGVHTFITLVLRSNHAPWFVISTIVLGWLAALLIGAVPTSVYSPTAGPVYGFVTLDCDITRAYPVAHVLIYFTPLFLSCFTSTIIYALVYLVLRGNITINGGLKFHMVPLSQSWRLQDNNVEQYKRFVRAVAWSMIWFPVAFAVCVIPNAIVQLLDTSGTRTTSSGTAFSLVLRHMNGILDVLIFYNVLRVVGPVFQSRVPNLEKAMLSGDVPPNALYENRPHQKVTGINPPESSRKPWQTHRHGGSDDSAANSLTLLLPSNTSVMSRGDIGNTHYGGSDTGHPRTVTKAMISKPKLMDSEDVPVGGIYARPSPRVDSLRSPSLTAETSQHRFVAVSSLNEFLHTSEPDGYPASPVVSWGAMHKPLPLLPEIRKTVVSTVQNYTHAMSTSAGVPKLAPIARPAAFLSSTRNLSRISPIITAPAPVKVLHSQLTVDAGDSRRRRLGSEHEIVVQPFSPAMHHGRPGDRATAVISLYMSSRRSVHEDSLPDFPTTASEFQTEVSSPRPAGESRDFINPAPPPRVARRSPSPPAPLSRPVIQPLRPRSPPQEAPPATAVLTEFDVNEYLQSPPPPVPMLPSAFVAAKEQKWQPPSPVRTELDVDEYYTEESRDEVPGLPPLPRFQPRLTVYDDELSIYSASTTMTGFGFGLRPRDSSLMQRRVMPLPEHMRLDINVSPVALTVPTPKAAPPTRGFRPIL